MFTSPLFRIVTSVWLILALVFVLIAIADPLIGALNFVGFFIWLGIALIGGAFGIRALWRFSRVGFDINNFNNPTPFYIKDSNRS